MSLMAPAEICLSCLTSRLAPGRVDFVPPDVALSRLRDMTGQDFRYDADAWRVWLLAHNLIRPYPRKPHNGEPGAADVTSEVEAVLGDARIAIARRPP